MTEAALREEYDIAVVGAGPAGSSAAASAAKMGARVLIIDRRLKIGLPVQCAELVTRWISRYACFSPACIIQATEKMVTHCWSGGTFEQVSGMESPGYMLDRSLFDRELAASAVLAGAALATGTKAVGLSPEGLMIEHRSERHTLRAKLIIGADGVHSRIARWAGLPRLRFIPALQYEIVLAQPQTQSEVFFHPDYEGGYAWFFPKGKTANAGLGILPGKAVSLRHLLDRFLQHLRMSGKVLRVAVVGMTGGSVPCEVRQKTVIRNILLTGDAAGHAHPITGAGIFHAVIGGGIAGRVAAEAVSLRDMNHLETYETEWKDAFGKTLWYGAGKRTYLETHWKSPGIRFEDLVRNTWVGFKEYYQNRKNNLNPTGG